MILVELGNSSGTLDVAAARLRKARINVKYVYVASAWPRAKITVVIGVSNVQAARKALRGL